MQQLNKNTRGFTVVEIMVVFLIFIAMLDTVWMIYKSSLNTNTVLSESLNAQEDVRRAFSSMTAGLRSASQSSTGSYLIAAASSTALTYYSDIDRDGLKEQVRYFMSGNNLRQGIVEPSGSPISYNNANEKVTTMVRNVIRDDSKPLFSYYDSSYDGDDPALTEPISLIDIRLIKINISVDKDPLTPPAATEFTTQVFIRNLKDN
jgi:type II secretory pathway pseudopilin PulG